ncbi:MAG TPA: methyltransferase domain-containing protein [Gaiellaceae bacterium]|nr:methyltransferase domain-containing protein [Gaiellaceae bacterium]
MRRTTPLSNHWGLDRGTPVDRFFIERFLESRRADVTGRVLEIADDRYTSRYGSRVSASDVLDVDSANPRATLVGDLSVPETLPAGAYDCFILTQTLQYVFDLDAAVSSVERVLAPGGVVLATAPALGRMDATVGFDRDYWRFTATSLRRLFQERFPLDLEVATFGNVLLASAFLFGVAAEELRAHELETNDPLFPLVVTLRARKGG